MKRGGSVLITGAGGCIGSALAERIAKSGAQNVILLDHAEHELHEIELALSAIGDCAPHVAVLSGPASAAWPRGLTTAMKGNSSTTGAGNQTNPHAARWGSRLNSTARASSDLESASPMA